MHQCGRVSTVSESPHHVLTIFYFCNFCDFRNGITNSPSLLLGSALRELDRRNVIKSDPFILMQGDVVTNVDLREAMKGHKARRKKDNAAIMTVLLQEVGGWGLDDESDCEETFDNPNSPNDHTYWHDHQLPPLRSSADDLLLALDATHDNRILLWDSRPHNANASVPTIFFQENSSNIMLTRNHLDVGIDICSPDVLARFSDEFDYRELRSQFVANCVAEEEIGLQSRIFAHVMRRGEYAGRMGDARRYHRVSMDLLRRWCYPLVPDNYGHCIDGTCSGSYVVDRHLVYRDVGGRVSGKRSHIGRSTRLSGPLLLGPNNSIGERCLLRRSVLGPNVTVKDDCAIVDSHLWGNVVVEEEAQLSGALVCEGAIVKRGAVVERGCVIGRGCVVGEGLRLKEFTRITCAAEVEDEDDYSGFDDSSSSEEESSSEDSDSDEEQGEGSESSYEKVKSKVALDVDAPKKEADLSADTITDHEIVGKDGLGRVYVPSLPDDYDSDDDKEEAQAATIELMKSQSIGYDMALIYRKWKKQQTEDEDDGFSLDEMDGDSDGLDMEEDWANEALTGSGTNAAASSHLDTDGMQITGRQKGVDVVRELRDICLEHETSSPVENLRIELNSFKFSQNATYADCCQGVMMAVMEKILDENPGEETLAPGRLVASLKKMLNYWGPLFESLCIGSGEEKAIVHALESMALGGSAATHPAAPAALGREPAFRFVLQTLHDRETVNEEAIFAWARERREQGRDEPMAALFWQKPTQDFLEWLEDDSDSSSDNEGDINSSEEDSD